MAVGDLVRMANQIAANLAHHPPEEAAAELANHLRLFWAPSMRAELAGSGPDVLGSLDPVARAGLQLSLTPTGQREARDAPSPPAAAGSQTPP